MIVNCGWCRKFLYSAAPEDDGIISHGICGPCARKLRDEETVPAWGESLAVIELAQNLYAARALHVGSKMTWDMLTPRQHAGYREEVVKLITDTWPLIWGPWKPSPTQQADGFREVLNMRSHEQEQP